MISRFHKFEPLIWLWADSTEPSWDSLFLPLSPSAPPLLVLSHSLSNKLKDFFSSLWGKSMMLPTTTQTCSRSKRKKNPFFCILKFFRIKSVVLLSFSNASIETGFENYLNVYQTNIILNADRQFSRALTRVPRLSGVTPQPILPCPVGNARACRGRQELLGVQAGVYNSQFSCSWSHRSTLNTKFLGLLSGRVLIGVQGSVYGSSCGSPVVLLATFSSCARTGKKTWHHRAQEPGGMWGSLGPFHPKHLHLEFLT